MRMAISVDLFVACRVETTTTRNPKSFLDTSAGMAYSIPQSHRFQKKQALEFN